MNSLVGVRMNTTGSHSATRASRQVAAGQVSSNFLAKVRAILTKAGYLATKAKTPAGAAASGAKSASNTGATGGAKAATSSDASGTRQVNRELDKDVFLQLMVTQMQNQDPLSPMDNTQMIAQLAQFSSLEQMNNLNTNFNTLSGNVQQLSFLTANSLIGRNVTGTDSDGAEVQGAVDRVVLDQGAVYLLVNGTKVPVSNISAVADAASEKK